MNTGERIKSLRIIKGLTLDEVAKATGTIKQTIYKYEHSIVINIPYDKIKALAAILETTPAYLLCYIDDPDPNLDYKELVEKHKQMELSTVKETKEALDKAFQARTEADNRLINSAHEICFRTPVSGVDDSIGPCNDRRIDVITDFISGNEKYLRVLLTASDEKQRDNEDSSTAKD